MALYPGKQEPYNCNEWFSYDRKLATQLIEVQKKAQAELDAIVGDDRLPSFADRPHMPYVDALCKEVLR